MKTEDQPIGTVRVSNKFGTVAVYVKIQDNAWHCGYVDPSGNEHPLFPSREVSDNVACFHSRIVFMPESVA